MNVTLRPPGDGEKLLPGITPWRTEASNIPTRLYLGKMSQPFSCGCLQRGRQGFVRVRLMKEMCWWEGKRGAGAV